MLRAEIIDGDRPRISIKYVNDLDREVVLPNPAPFEILSIDGKVLYSPVSAQVIKTVAPGDMLVWEVDLADLEDMEANVLVVRFKLLEPRDTIIYIIRRG